MLRAPQSSGGRRIWQHMIVFSSRFPAIARFGNFATSEAAWSKFRSRAASSSRMRSHCFAPHRLAGASLKDGSLLDLFPGHDVSATDFETAAWILYPSRAYMPRKLRAGIDFIKANIGSV